MDSELAKLKEENEANRIDYKSLYEKELRVKEAYKKVNKKLKEENKKLKEKSLKQELCEAMKENSSWITRMKMDHEVQLRTQKDMVTMYYKEIKKLKEENKQCNKIIRQAKRDRGYSVTDSEEEDSDSE